MFGDWIQTQNGGRYSVHAQRWRTLHMRCTSYVIHYVISGVANLMFCEMFVVTQSACKSGPQEDQINVRALVHEHLANLFEMVVPINFFIIFKFTYLN